MPLPVFYLEFQNEHGRRPTPDELTSDQRRSLLECCMENIDLAAKVEIHIKNIDKQIAYLEREPKSKLVSYKLTMLHRTRQNFKEFYKPDIDYWYDVIEQCVGTKPIEGDEAEDEGEEG